MNRPLSPALPQPPQASTRRPLGVRHQVGLKAVRVSHRHAGWVNVHDPVASKFHRLREDEYFLLRQLDGRCSLNDLKESYQAEYPNRRVTPAQINALLFRFHESGLTISHAPGQGKPLWLNSQQQRRKKWLAAASQWLFIRFPGMDPAPVMRFLRPLTRPLLSRPGLFGFAMLVVSAVVLMIIHRDRYIAELPSAKMWLSAGNVIILAGIVAATKIAHELGHAAVSEHFGARCRTIGPMLLVGTPALYCDTSESWMLPSRFQRAAVALAGIATEIVIAAIAAWVWCTSGDGLIHTIASHVIVVCGISTVLFNANPLLRYDGYYLLSDLTDVPNLGSRANRRLKRWLSRWCLGIVENQPIAEPADDSIWILVYAIAALIYRQVLMFTIIAFIWVALRPYGLQIIGQIAALVAASSLLLAGLIPLRKFLMNPTHRKKIRMSRVVLSTLTFAAVVATGFYPLPSQVIATARIVPQEETRVFVKSPGQLIELHVHPGQSVRQDELLAVLENHATELELIEAEGKYQTQLSRIESLKISQTLVPEAAEHLVAAESYLEELEQALEAVQRKQASLRIRAPCDGRVLAASGNRSHAIETLPTIDDDGLSPDAESDPTMQHVDARLASWSGHPTDHGNLDCYFESGTELLSVASRDRWLAMATIDSTQAMSLTVGDDAEIILDRRPEQVYRGTLLSLAEEKFDPRVDANRRDHPAGTQQQFTPATRYLANVEIEGLGTDNSEANLVELGDTAIVGAAARIRIATPSRSFWQRVTEAFAGVFRFR